jgi:hypothetical protein
MHRLKNIPPGKLAAAIPMAQEYTRFVLEGEGHKDITAVTPPEVNMAYNHGILAATLSLALSPKEMDLFAEILNKVSELCRAQIEAMESGAAE